MFVRRLGCLLRTSAIGTKFCLFIASDASAFFRFMPSIGRGCGALYGIKEGAVEAGIGDVHVGVSEGTGGGTEGGGSSGGG